jgi:hypothetical protein
MATPDTGVTEAALRSCSLTVQVSTKLNRSHMVHGDTALILPSLGRTDRDIQNGTKQQVSGAVGAVRRRLRRHPRRDRGGGARLRGL